MKWRMIVTTDDDRWTETAQTLSNLLAGSHSRKYGSSKLLQETTGITLEFPPQVRTPNLVESCQHPCPGQKLPIRNWRKLGMIGQHIFIPLLHKRQRGSLFDLLQQTVDEPSQFAKRVVPVVICCLTMDEIIRN